MQKKGLILLTILVLIIVTFYGCTDISFYTDPFQNTQSPSSNDPVNSIDSDTTDLPNSLDKSGTYSTPEEVADYIHFFEKLPDNYITKKDAMVLGWESNKGNLWEVTDEKSIGGDVFGNREGILPSEKGRKWYECDVNYYGGFRGTERIVYSNDGLIYYTEDHYETFTQIY